MGMGICASGAEHLAQCAIGRKRDKLVYPAVCLAASLLVKVLSF
jgi:hypothetical protein